MSNGDEWRLVYFNDDHENRSRDLDSDCADDVFETI